MWTYRKKILFCWLYFAPGQISSILLFTKVLVLQPAQKKGKNCFFFKTFLLQYRYYNINYKVVPTLQYVLWSTARVAAFCNGGVADQMEVSKLLILKHVIHICMYIEKNSRSWYIKWGLFNLKDILIKRAHVQSISD